MSEINLGQVVGPKGDRGDTGLINGATQVQVHSTTKVMYNGSLIPANTAASRLVGESFGNVMQVGAFGLGGSAPKIDNTVYTALKDVTTTGFFSIYAQLTDAPIGSSQAYFRGAMTNIRRADSPDVVQLVTYLNGTTPTLYARVASPSAANTWSKLYSNTNTTLDGNGALKPSSPVLRVFSDCITGNDDGEAMGATYTKNGVGDYTITGTTGLRTDGWYVVIPNDMNGNPKVAITLDDTDGVITLKTYVRIFDMTTFKFVPDLEQPLDIPDGRWIDLRFNDLPVDDDALTDEV